jgi:cell division protein FtsQ
MDVRTGKQTQRSLHWIVQTIKMGLLGIVVISCIFLVDEFKFSRFFPITTVRVYGMSHVEPNEVQPLLLPLVNHGFFTVNVDYIHDRLLQIPWVADIFVRRAWPDKVEITIIEKNAIARWNDESLLSESGELFMPAQATYPTALPHFFGPEGKQILMLQYFYEINRLLAPLHAKISYLELSPYASWKATLDNGITLQMGHKDILDRLGQFVKVYPKIVGGHSADVQYIDLRYPNGIAVRWKASQDA